MANFALLESQNLISRKIWVIEKIWNLTLCPITPQCGNYGNFLSRIFGKTFVKLKITGLLNKLLKSWFDEIFFLVRENFSFFHTMHCVQIYSDTPIVEITENYSHRKMSRKINFLVMNHQRKNWEKNAKKSTIKMNGSI